MSIFKKPYFVISILLSACLYLFVAWNNELYIHPDEYFQIVEFASYEMGISPAAGLPWEFQDRIRPAFQPWLCYTLFNGLQAAGINDHYAHLFFLRFLSACFSLGAVTLFCVVNLRYFEVRYHKYYVLATYLFWLPYYYGTRFSSETWSGNLILVAVSLVLLYQQGRIRWNRNLFFALVGITCGLAFIFRFQVAFFIVGLALYLAFIRRETILSLLCFAAGGLLMLGVGAVADYWLYGQWVFTPWLYFESNLVKGVASHFGTEPFYMYLLWLLLFPSPVVGVVVVLALGVLVWRLPKHIYTWLLIPFIVGHSVIGHKELRFIFPVFSFLPVVVFVAYQAVHQQYGVSFSKWGRAWRGTFLFLAILPNFLMLLVLVLLANQFSTCPKTFDGAIHQRWKDTPVSIVYVAPRTHPYLLAKGVIPYDIFPEYQRDSISNILLSNYCAIDSLPSTANYIVSTTWYEMENDPCLKTYKDKYIITIHSFPLWVMRLPLEKYIGKQLKEELDRNVFCILEPDK